MTARRSKRAQPRGERRFQVGDRVRFAFGLRRVTGVIVEERGPIGYGGRRLYAVRAKLDIASEPVVFELPAENFQAA